MSGAAALPDTIRRGLGIAARAVGDWFGLFRPNGPNAPLAAANQLIRLPAAFAGLSGFGVPVGYGEALWQGLFDAGYSQPGDYLSGPNSIFFIAAMPRLAPPLCVLTNRTLTLSRPAAPVAAGMNRYVSTIAAVPLLSGWPASVLSAGTGGRGALPGDAPGTLGGAGGWAVLLPDAGVVLRTGDLVTDDLARQGVVTAAELSHLGWRLHVKQATS